MSHSESLIWASFRIADDLEQKQTKFPITPLTSNEVF